MSIKVFLGHKSRITEVTGELWFVVVHLVDVSLQRGVVLEADAARGTQERLGVRRHVRGVVPLVVERLVARLALKPSLKVILLVANQRLPRWVPLATTLTTPVFCLTSAR